MCLQKVQNVGFYHIREYLPCNLNLLLTNINTSEIGIPSLLEEVEQFPVSAGYIQDRVVSSFRQPTTEVIIPYLSRTRRCDSIKFLVRILESGHVFFINAGALIHYEFPILFSRSCKVSRLSCDSRTCSVYTCPIDSFVLNYLKYSHQRI